MNNQQFLNILRDLNINTLFWAPELLDTVICYDKIPKNCKCGDLFVEKHTTCKGGICLYNIAIIGLHQNRDAFKNRILGKINDNWINKQNLGYVALPCYSILTKIGEKEGLEDWQITLKNIFKDMIDQM